MPDVKRVTARVDAHSAARQVLTERAEAQVLRLVSGFDGWYDHPAISRLTAEVVRYVESAQRGLAQATDAYLSQVATEIVGRTIAPVGIIDPSGLRQGVTHEGVYGRLADQYRYQTALGLPQSDVMAGVIARAKTMIATDMTLAFTHQSRRVMKSSRLIEGYRRVIRPEMSKTGTCGLCIAASDRIYDRADLLPIHDGSCHCTVLPIVGGHDPGRSLNQDELDYVYGESGSTRGDDLRNTQLQVKENGEIGPVLVQRGHAHRGPSDL